MRSKGSLFSHLFLKILLVMLLILTVTRICGIHPFIVMSGSMEPELPAGGICFVNTGVPYEKIAEGDVIAYRSFQGNLVTHRVIMITDEGFLTKGDANETTDGISATRENFVGKTMFGIPYAGYVLYIFQQPQNLFGCLAVFMILKLLKDFRKNRESTG